MRTPNIRWLGALLTCLAVAACTGGSTGNRPLSLVLSSPVPLASSVDGSTRTPPSLPDDGAGRPTTSSHTALGLFLGSAVARKGSDVIEVWVCEVPLGTTDRTFNPSTLRLDLDPATLTGLLNRYVQAYFTDLSHGQYKPVFVPGHTHVMTNSESPQQCLDAALNGSSTTSNSVLAVATAEDAAAAEGGFATPGSACAKGAYNLCAARSTRRGAYVGASDFHPDWGPEPAIDLEEHEIGHTLGWPHSGLPADGHVSGIDVMSNSAAPRDFDPTRRDGPDTLAVNRLAAGWIPIADIAIRSDITAAVTTTLRPSTSATGVRLLVLPVDARRFLTVEYLPKTGFDDFLPIGGVTITLIDQSASACGHTDNSPCTGVLRQQVTEVGSAPFYALLTPSSPAWTGLGWIVSVTSLGSNATVRTAAATR